MVVPKLLTPPAILNRCEPVSRLPKAMAKGFAAVCCKENPSPTTINPLNSMGKEAVSAAGMNIKLPMALITKPKAMPFP